MSDILEVPEWVKDFLYAGCEKLRLNDWNVSVVMALCVNDDPSICAVCDQYPDINSATITIRADIEDTDEWCIVLVHELLHVAHSRIDHLIDFAIIPHLDESARMIAHEAYRQAYESYIHNLATAIYGLGQK